MHFPSDLVISLVRMRRNGYLGTSEQKFEPVDLDFL